MVDSEKLSFGYNFKRICKENGIKIKEVHEGTKIPLNTLYSITKRKTKMPTADVKHKIMSYLQKRIPGFTWNDFYQSNDEENDTNSNEQLNSRVEYRNRGEADFLTNLGMNLFKSLNDEGKKKAIMMLSDLMVMEEYKKED